MSEDNKTRQTDEVEALAAIYGTDWCVLSEKSQDYCIHIHDGNPKSQWSISLEIHLPANYPESSPPHYQMMAPWLSRQEKANLETALADIYCENIGESIIYLWIEKVREVVNTKSGHGGAGDCELESTEPGEGENIAHADLDFDELAFDFSSLCTNTADQPDPEEVLECPVISHGDPVVDRKSTFQSHLAPVVHKKQVQMVLDSLYENRKVKNATHNILAYRIQHNSVVYQGCDDDGETSAGSRLLHLLQILDASDVMVVVSRWYGGILLGPDRFKHINNTARTLLEQHGYIKAKAKKGPQSGGGKKKK